MSKVEVRDVSVRFDGLAALDGVSLEVGSGRILGLIGPNGAGKTTLFDCLSGFRRPDSGEVLLDGRSIVKLSPHRRARIGVRRTFQDVGLCKDHTVRENLAIAQHQHARPFRNDELLRQEAEGILADVGLTGHGEHTIRRLSAGLMRRAEVACALAGRPELLLLDEPGAGLDPAATEALADLLRRLRDERGVTLIVIGHVMRLVHACADAITVLDSGKVLATGTPAEIRDDPDVAVAYTGRR